MGASRSAVNRQIGTWLGHINGSQVSFSSGATSLGETKDYPYFMRTIPANSIQAQVN